MLMNSLVPLHHLYYPRVRVRRRTGANTASDSSADANLGCKSQYVT